MTERVIGPTGSPRRRWTLLLPFAAAIAFALFSIAGAQAIHEINLFQLDRNAEDAGGAGDDWDTPPNPPGGDFSGIDPDIGADGGTQFQGGGSKDDADIDQWLWKAGEPLDKDDITNAYAAAYKNTVDTGLNNLGDQLIYFGLDRFSVDGSAQVGFWFLQDPNFGLSQTASGGGFKFNGVHQNNDTLVQANFSNGGVIGTITVYKWQNGALVQVAGATDCIGPPATSGDDPACGVVNRTPTDAPWDYTPKSGPAGTFPTSAFFEAGINISRLIPGAGCFTAFMAETRSSTPFDARLKDFVIGDLDTCVRDVKVTKEPDAGDAGSSVNAGNNISFTIKVENIGNVSAENVTLHDDLPDSNLNWSITSQPAGNPCAITGAVGSQDLDCTFGTLQVGAAGDRIVTITSPTTAASCGTKPNSVTVSATGDINASNNTDTGSITVNCGAIRILKNSNKASSDRVNRAGAVFGITGPGITGSLSVTDDNTTAAPDEDADIGEVCVDGLQPTQSYSITETSPPTGYGASTGGAQSVTAAVGDCSSTPGASATATFVNPPLGEFIIDFNDLSGGDARGKIDCTGLTPTPVDGTPGAFDDNIETYTNLPGSPSPGTAYNCTITIDP
jgi:uncharacterized repeat protein (TIGR01451 family)